MSSAIRHILPRRRKAVFRLGFVLTLFFFFISYNQECIFGKGTKGNVPLQNETSMRSSARLLTDKWLPSAAGRNQTNKTSVVAVPHGGRYEERSWRTTSGYLDRWIPMSGLRGKERYKLNHPGICRDNGTYMLVVVKSAPHYFEKRWVCRQTFGPVSSIVDGRKIKIIFMLAMPTNKTLQKKIEEEDATYQDIVQISNFIDDYKTNTYKTLVVFQWALEYCPAVKYVSYVDDDVLLFLKRLVSFLVKSGDIIRPLYGGYLFNEGQGEVRPADKTIWYVNRTDFFSDVYPAYIPGCGTVFSLDAIAKILNGCRTLPFMFHVDDAYLGVCARVAGVEPVHIPGFLYANFNGDPKSWILIHGLSNNERLIWSYGLK